MSEWKEVRLGSLVRRKIGYGIVQPGASPEKGVPVIKANNIIAGLTSIDELDNTTQEIDSKYPRTKLNGGELIISLVGTVGKTAIVPSSFAGCNLVRATGLIDIEDPSLTKWVKYYIASSKGQYYINTNLNTTVQATLNVKSLAEMPIPIPPKREMGKMVDILSSLDDKIAVNRRICENLEAQAQALFKNWFVDFAPFKNGKFVESELGMIPEGWRVGSPYEYLDFIYGAPYKSNLFNDKKEGLPLIRIRDLKDCSPQFYTPEILPKSEYVNAGDILAGMDAEFAPFIWKGQQGLLNQRVCKIKPKSEEIGRLFCMLLVKPQLLFVQAVKTGTTVSHIGKSDIDRFKVILPPLSEVIKFSKLGEEIFDEIITLSAESSRLSTLRDTLLPKLMSGEIKI